MKTAPRLDVELGEALHAYAERIPATPDIARLHTALDAAPAAVLPRQRAASWRPASPPASPSSSGARQPGPSPTISRATSRRST